MPANDNWANATGLSGVAGPAVLTSQTTTGAGHEAGEPQSHYNYSPGPSTPVARSLIAANATVWYSWTCPTNGNYYFTTQDLTGGLATNYASTVRVYTGASLAGLSAVALLMDQGSGDSWGSDNGASVAFAAVASTVYYIQVDGRNGATGNFQIGWGPWSPERLGTCTGETVNLDPSVVCVGAIAFTSTTAAATFFSFGSQPVVAGNYRVAYVDGTAVPELVNAVPIDTISGPISGGPTVYPNAVITDADMTGVLLWDGSTSYSAGQKVIYVPTNVFGEADGAQIAIALGGEAIGTPPQSDGFWTLLNSDPLTFPTAICAYSGPVVPGAVHSATGFIGVILLTTGTAIVSPYPNYSLLYFPMDATVLNNSPGFAITGSGTSWSISFDIENASSQTWDNCTVTLLSSGGVSSPSAALTGVSLTNNASTSVGSFTFTATPGLVTATIEIRRNGQLAATLAYPLYPIVAASFSKLNDVENTCSGTKVWHSQIKVNLIWPPAMSDPWGDSSWTTGWLGCDFLPTHNLLNSSLTITGQTMYDNSCAVQTSITDVEGSICTPLSWTLDFQVQATSGSQSIPVTVAFDFQTAASTHNALPPFTQTITVPPA